MKSTRGVLKFVQFGQKPAVVPESLIQVYQDTEWDGLEKYPPGAPVKLTSGAFNHVDAIVKTAKRDRILVVMNIMQSQVETWVSPQHIQAA